MIPESSQGRRSVLLAVALLGALTLLWLALSFRFPLAPDETYYWEWSRRSALGYYDQGPLIAWWIRASCMLFGDTVLGIRFGIVAAALATQVFLFLLARDLFGARIGLLSLLPASLTPLALAGGFIATYDPLVALFWAAAAYGSARALLFGSRSAWVGVGVAFGLGLLSKHTMALFAPCLLLFLTTRPEMRRWLRRPEPYLAGLLGLLLFSPSLVWQSQHDWMTFRHLLHLTGKGEINAPLRQVGDFLGSQVGVITPLLFLGLVGTSVGVARRRRDVSAGEWLLFMLGAPVLAFFLLMSVKTKVQANWAVTGWLTAPALFTAWAFRDEGRAKGETRTEPEPASSVSAGHHGGSATAVLAVPEHRAPPSALPANRRRAAFFAISMAMAAALVALMAWPEARRPLHLNVPHKWDQMNKLYGGPELGAAADRERRAMEAEVGGPVAAGAATYDTASRMAFYMPGQPRTRCLFLGTRINSYVLWNDEAGLRPGGSAIVADGRAPDDPKRPRLEAVFARVVPVAAPVRVYRAGVYDGPVETYYLYRCYGYHPNPGAETPVRG